MYEPILLSVAEADEETETVTWEQLLDTEEAVEEEVEEEEEDSEEAEENDEDEESFDDFVARLLADEDVDAVVAFEFRPTEEKDPCGCFG